MDSSSQKIYNHPSLSKEVDLELGQGNAGMPLEQSGDQQQQNQFAQQPQNKAVKKPSKMMVQPQMNKNAAQEANECKDICSTMHANQFGENNIDVVPKQRVWFTKKIIACIILIILVLIGVGGGSIWYFYPGEAKKDKDESPTKSDVDVEALRFEAASNSAIQREPGAGSNQDAVASPTKQSACAGTNLSQKRAVVKVNEFDGERNDDARENNSPRVQQPAGVTAAEDLSVEAPTMELQPPRAETSLTKTFKKLNEKIVYVKTSQPGFLRDYQVNYETEAIVVLDGSDNSHSIRLEITGAKIIGHFKDTREVRREIKNITERKSSSGKISITITFAA